MRWMDGMEWNGMGWDGTDGGVNGVRVSSVVGSRRYPVLKELSLLIGY